MNSRNFFHHRFFHYFISFRFGEFSSALRSVIDNKQINFHCFFKILSSWSRMSPKFVSIIIILFKRMYLNMLSKVNVFEHNESMNVMKHKASL